MAYKRIGLVTVLAVMLGCEDSAKVNSDTVPDYIAGEFEPSGYFKHSCASPRSGTDPWTGSGYRDRQGLVSHENFWLRSWSDETYLWYDEIVDQDPRLFDEPTVYFQQLKTERLTQSGRQVDRFHFTYDSQAWFDLIQNGQSLGYGAEFIQTRASVPREIRIAFVEPGSPAEAAGWARGDYVVTVDGVAVADNLTSAQIAALNAGISPQNTASHEFVLRDTSGVETTTTLTPATIAASAVFHTDVLQSGDQRIGYLVFNDHNAIAESQLLEALSDMKTSGIDELVVDLRYNGGGYLWIASELAAMIAGEVTDGLVFERSVFNDKLVDRHPNSGDRVEPTPFFTQALGFSLEQGTPLPLLNLSRVVFLTGAGTCSASESIINGLLGIDFDVILVGTTTCGKPYGFFANDNCGTTYFTVQSQGENAKGFAAFSDGFSPMDIPQNTGVLVNGCYVQDDFSRALGDAQEATLATALSYLQYGECPTPFAVSGAAKSTIEHQYIPLVGPEHTIKIY